MNDVNSRERLKPFAALIGDWSTEMTHPAFGDAVVKGWARFEWLAGERFLIQRAETEHPDFPNSICIIGVMEGGEDVSMQYFDSRGMHRVYHIGFDGAELRIWRDTPGFAQRFAAKLSAGGTILAGSWELNESGRGFRDDLAITYRRSIAASTT